NAADVVRWWVWPNFTGNGVAFDGNGAATGLAGTAAADIAAALDVAAQSGTHIQFTFFSFDNFKTNLAANRNLAPMIQDAAKRTALLNNAVAKFVQEVNKSANKD